MGCDDQQRSAERRGGAAVFADVDLFLVGGGHLGSQDLFVFARQEVGPRLKTVQSFRVGDQKRPAVLPVVGPGVVAKAD